VTRLHEGLRFNRTTLQRLNRSTTTNFDAATLADFEEDTVEGLATSLRRRKVRFKNHRLMPTETGNLSPFTIRKETES
jgi:hypothetical protein